MSSQNNNKRFENNNTSENLIKKWIYKKITTKEFLKNQPKEEKKEIKYPEPKCDCTDIFLTCEHCQKRIREEGPSMVDMYGDDFLENESDINQSNYDKWYC